MSFYVIVSIIIIIVAVSAAASFVLRDNEGRIKPALAVLSLVLAGFAAVLCAYGSENGTVYAKADGDPQATVRQFFDAVCAGDYSSADIVPLVRDCFRFIRDYRGEVPGADPKDCGNYLDMNLNMANYWGRKYAALLEHITPDRLVYPE